jgi:DNA polymerase III alpha subunit
MYRTLPLFKSHYSVGKSILTLNDPKDKEGNPITNSIFHLLTTNKLDTLVLVDDNVSGILQDSKNCSDLGIKFVFGLRIDVCEDMNQKDEASLIKRAKYIIMAKNSQGYQSILKLWSIAARQGFYYTPNIDFKTLKDNWNDNLKMMVPFYDSFLHLNSFYSYLHVPSAIEFFNPIFLTEENSLPFDLALRERLEKYCKDKYSLLPAQSIFYKSAEDFEAYLAFRCIHNRGSSQKSTLDEPGLDGMGSSEFNFDKWLAQEKA